MEFNEQTARTSKIDTDSLMESRMTALGEGWFEGGGIKQKWKRIHGHGQQGGDWGGRSIKRINNKENNTIKNGEKNPSIKCHLLLGSVSY